MPPIRLILMPCLLVVCGVPASIARRVLGAVVAVIMLAGCAAPSIASSFTTAPQQAAPILPTSPALTRPVPTIPSASPSRLLSFQAAPTETPSAASTPSPTKTLDPCPDPNLTRSPADRNRLAGYAHADIHQPARTLYRHAPGCLDGRDQSQWRGPISQPAKPGVT